MAQKGGELQYKVEGVTKSLSLFDEKTGDLKSTYQIFDELKENWEKMSNAEKQELAINSAGKNQFEVFVAELDRFTAVRKAYGLAVNDNNMAEKENARYMESISAKISLFRNQLQELILGNGGLSFLAKGFLDATNAILKFANSGIGQFIIKATLLKTAITGVTTAYNMLKASAKATALIETIQQVGQLTKDYGLLTGILRAYIIAKQQDTVASATNTSAIVAETGAKTADATATGALAEADGALNIMQEAQAGTATQSTVAIGAETGAKVANTTATGLLTTAQEALNIAMKSNPIGLVITALAGLYGAYKGLTYLCEKYTDTVDSLNEEADKHIQKADEHKNKLAQLESQYQENIDKIQKLSEEERNNASIDNSGKISGLKAQNELLQVQLETQQKLEDIERRRALNKKWKALNTTEDYKTFGSVSENSGDIDWDKGIASPIDQQEIHKKKLAEITKAYQDAIVQRREYVANVKKLSKEEQQASLEAIDNVLKGLKKGGDKEREYLLKNNEEIVNAMQMFFNNDGKIYSGYEKKYKKLNEALNDSKGTLEEYGNYLGDASEKTKEASDATGKYSDGLEELDGELEDSSEKAQTLTEALSSQVSAIEDIGSAYGTLKGAVSEYNKSGKLSLNTLKTLLSLNPKYLLALTNNNGKLSLNEKALKAQWKAEVDVYNQTLKTAESYALLAVQAGKTADEAIQAGLGIAQLGNQTQTTGNQANGARAGLENFTAGTDDISRGANQAINYLNSLGQGMAQFYRQWGGKELKTFQIYKSDDLMTNGMTDADRAYASQQGKHVVNRETKASKEAKKVKNFFKTFKMDDGAKSWNDIKISNSGSPSSSVGRSGGGGGRSRGGSGSSSASKTDKALEKAKKAVTKAIKANIKALDDQTKAYERSNKHAKKVLENAKKKAKALEDKVKLYEDVKKYIDQMYDDEINKLKELENEFQELVKVERDASTTSFVDKTGKKVEKNYVEVGRILEKAKNDLEKVTSKYDYLISKQERLRRADPQIKSTEALIKSLNEELKTKQKLNEEQERALRLKELEDALERAKNIRLKVFKKGQGFVYGQDEDAIREAQKNLNEYKKQKEVDDLQDRINKAQESLEALNKVYDDEIEKQEELKQQEEDTYHERYDTLQEWYDNQTRYYDDILDYRTEYKIHSEKLNRDITTKEVLESQKRIKNLENEKKKVDAIWEEREKKERNRLILKYTNLNAETTFEKDTYETRIKNLQKFVEDYEKLNARLDKANATVERAETKANRASKAYDFQKEQDTHQKNAQEKIEKKVDNAKTKKDAYKLKEASDRLIEYQTQLEKYQKDLLHYIKRGEMDVNSAITAYNNKAKALYSELKLKSFGIAFTASALGMNTKGTASMFGYGASAVKKKASGDASISSNGIYLVGDSPNQELVIGSKLNGVPMNLPQGTGVVNAKSTRTLAGMLNSMGMMKKNNIGTLNKTTNNNDSFSIGNVTVNGARIKDSKSFANELLNLKSEMLQLAYRK